MTPRGPSIAGASGLSACTLVFGLLPEELRDDERKMTLVDAEAARIVIRAAECRTWIEFVRLAGLRWDEAVRDCGRWMAELNGGECPVPDSVFTFSDVNGATLYQGEAAYWVGRWVERPQEAAIRALETRAKGCPAIWTVPGLEEDPGSPAGHIEGLYAAGPGVFAMMARELAASGISGMAFERDDDLVRRCLIL